MRTKSAFTKRTEEDDIFETHVLLYYLFKVRHAYVCVVIVIQRGHKVESLLIGVVL